MQELTLTKNTLILSYFIEWYSYLEKVEDEKTKLMVILVWGQAKVEQW